jgi:hypothetical protein
MWIPATAAHASSFPGTNGPIVFDQTTGPGVNCTTPCTTAIAVANADGSQVHTLTSPPANQSDIDPRVSADGKWIVFERTGFSFNFPGGASTVTHAMIMRANGSDLTDLTAGIGDDVFNPSFLPAGNAVVFELFDPSSGQFGQSHGIFEKAVTLPSTGAPTTGTTTQITTGIDSDPTVRADGHELAFIREASDASSASIYLCTLPSCAAPSQLTTHNEDGRPDFSPDGNEIVFERSNGLFEVSSGGGTPVQLATSPSGKRYERPSFSPDGQQIVFDENMFTVGPGGSPTHSLLTMAATPGATPTVIPGLAGTPTVANADPDWGVATPAPVPRPTSTVLKCSPSTFALGAQTTCTATVTDVGSGTRSSPGGTVAFFSNDPNGSFGSSNTCTLAGSTPGVSSCSATFTPSQVGGDQLTASYGGEVPLDPSSTHGSSAGNFTITVTQAAPAQTTTTTTTTSSTPPPTPPAPPQAPTVLTSGVTEVCGVAGVLPCPPPGPPGDVALHLEGTVNPNGSPVYDCEFTYPDPTGERSIGFADLCKFVNQDGKVVTVSPANPIVGSSPVTVFSDDIHILVGLLYHFQLSARNAIGAGTGDFKTYEQVQVPGVATVDVPQLGGPVASAQSAAGTALTSSIPLPGPAKQVTETVTTAAIARLARVARVNGVVLGQAVKRHVKAGHVTLHVQFSNHKLLARIRKALHRAHKQTVPATITIIVKLAHGAPVRVVQHIKLRF